MTSSIANTGGLRCCPSIFSPSTIILYGTENNLTSHGSFICENFTGAWSVSLGPWLLYRWSYLFRYGHTYCWIVNAIPSIKFGLYSAPYPHCITVLLLKGYRDHMIPSHLIYVLTHPCQSWDHVLHPSLIDTF